MQNNIISEYYSIIKNKISQRRFESAKESIQKLLQYFPNNEKAYYYNGVCNFAQENYIEAIKSYSYAIRINPAYAKAYFNLGACYVITKEYDLALINIGKALIIFSKLKELDYKEKCIQAIKTIEMERRS